jgi:hypothetical protein
MLLIGYKSNLQFGFTYTDRFVHLLTFLLRLFNVVKDCGCFGAIKTNSRDVAPQRMFVVLFLYAYFGKLKR